jgi:dipeptidase E
MPELMLLSNSFSPGQAALEHAMDALAILLDGAREVLFVPYAGSDPNGYTEAMGTVLGSLGVCVAGAHRAGDPVTALARADAVFVGGGNAFRLLRAVQRNGLLAAIGARARARAGMPYLGVSAGANLACPTIRTTNDMPVVQPASLAALGLIPFQVNPHYPAAGAHDPRAALGGTAGGRLFVRGQAPRDVQPGDDLTALLETRPRFDSPAR